jgi:hypothetical protein
LEGDEIDIVDLQGLGLLADSETNTAKQLTESIWVYGPDHSLRRQQTTNHTLVDAPIVMEYLQQFHAGDYNIGFLAYPLAGQQLP